jgi:hypothetical protein
MSYLLYVALFGEISVIFLWMRDIRIFYLTGLTGYRKAAYYGVLYGAIATFGLLIALWYVDIEVVGLGVIIASLFLQERNKKEKIWKNESAWERFFGSVRPVRKK